MKYNDSDWQFFAIYYGGMMYLGGVCFITDRTYTDLSPYEMTLLVLKAGIRFIQYRDKEMSRRKLYEEAMRLRKLTREFNAVFVVNDYADIALAVEADGVHLGQDDLPLNEARKIMGKRTIGISTHNLQQAMEAQKGGADYIGFGPVFNTTTKDAGAPRGIDSLKLIKQNVSIPVVAIGGITAETLESVINAGADAVAVATAICRGDISENSRRFMEILK